MGGFFLLSIFSRTFSFDNKERLLFSLSKNFPTFFFLCTYTIYVLLQRFFICTSIIFVHRASQTSYITSISLLVCHCVR
ncbi:unnamed protein product [Meloidogyne enterolobii]|uniref:Uncharacterized protein n=1 Tax=Meloidogyne enterolobii TaxID=390850 RepID=A0ACB0Z8L6_MELEN